MEAPVLRLELPQRIEEPNLQWTDFVDGVARDMRRAESRLELLESMDADERILALENENSHLRRRLIRMELCWERFFGGAYYEHQWG